MTLRIVLLGQPHMSRDGLELNLPGYRPLALLAYLLLTKKAHSREHLADFLFDRPADPRAALRWVLTQCRKALGPDTILADRQEIRFNFAADVWLDVDAFEAGDLDLYQGEFLAGIDLRDAHRFEIWLLGERERLRALYETGLEHRLAAAQAAGDTAAAEKAARRLLQLDDLREDWHQALMTALAAQGRFEAARAQYELCQKILRAELAVEPSPETTALAAAIEQKQNETYRAVTGAAPSILSPANLASPSSTAAEAILSRENPGKAPAGIRRRPPPKQALITGAVVFGLSVLLLFGLAWTRRPAPSTGRGENEPADAILAGKTVTLGRISFPDDDLIEEQTLRPFEESTGIQIETILYGSDFEQIIPSVVDSGLKPDILLVPQPGLVADLARRGEVVDVRTFMDDAFLRAHYSDALLDSATFNGQMIGVWQSASVKSLIWYPPRPLAAAGYQVPQTWEALMALTAQMAADGRTPWCIGIEEGNASGWIGTDWIENILLRTAPPQTFDAWAAGALPFDSPEIRRAFAILGEIWLTDAYVFGGTSRIAAEHVQTVSDHLFAEPPGCFFYLMGSFAPAFFPEEAIYGEDYDFFLLPPIDPAYGSPVLGGGDMAVMLDDRPEVRETMHYLASGESVRFFVEEGVFISPHKDARFDWYASPLQLKVAQVLLEANTFRFDGSDLMPPAVGTSAFWRGIVDWTAGADLEAVLHEIDASWPRHDN